MDAYFQHLWIEDRPLEFSQCSWNPGVSTLLQSLGQLPLPQQPHLIFHGPAGSGKSTRIWIFLRTILGKDVQNSRQVKEFISPDKVGSLPESASALSFVESLQTIELFCSSWSSSHQMKWLERLSFLGDVFYPGETLRYVIFWEADKLSLLSQNALRRQMEQLSHKFRFIFVSQFIDRLTLALRSRCCVVRCASPTTNELIKSILTRCPVPFSNDELQSIVENHDHDAIRVFCKVQEMMLLRLNSKSDVTKDSNCMGHSEKNSSLGLTDNSSLGLTDNSSLGLTGNSSLGLTDNSSLGLTDNSSLGLTDDQTRQSESWMILVHKAFSHLKSMRDDESDIKTVSHFQKCRECFFQLMSNQIPLSSFVFAFWNKLDKSLKEDDDILCETVSLFRDKNSDTMLLLEKWFVTIASAMQKQNKKPVVV